MLLMVVVVAEETLDVEFGKCRDWFSEIGEQP
jgi:hypothetical protein